MPTIKRQYEKLERNELCPCDENMELEESKQKKYKKCCLQKMVLQEQRGREMLNDKKEIAEVKKYVAAAIQHDIDHPIILTDRKITVPDSGCSDIILP